MMDGPKQFMATRTEHKKISKNSYEEKRGQSVMKITCDCSRKKFSKS